MKSGKSKALCPVKSGSKRVSRASCADGVKEQYGGIEADFLYSVVINEEIAKLGLTGIGWGLHTEIVAPYIQNNGS